MNISLLYAKLKTAEEALESIAFLDQPHASRVSYWKKRMKTSNSIANTLANDTDIARRALAKIRSKK